MRGKNSRHKEELSFAALFLDLTEKKSLKKRNEVGDQHRKLHDIKPRIKE